MESVRKLASLFISAHSAKELVFVCGTTEGISLMVDNWGSSSVRAGGNVITNETEHHANTVLWQMPCACVRAEPRTIPPNVDGTLQLGTLLALFDDRT